MSKSCDLCGQHRFGPLNHRSIFTGVYGTALPPSAGKRAIAYNNWTQGWEQRERGGRVELVFKIRVPETSVQVHMGPSRHIYLHKGAIRLNDYQWQLFKV